MIKILLSGCNGKMGQVISYLAEQDEDVEIVAGFDVSESRKNPYPTYTDPADFDDKADVIIDFSHPDALNRLLDFAVSSKTPAVIATTGLSAGQVERLRRAAYEIPIFFSANMSLGVNLIIDLAARAAKILEGNFDIEIVEKHHNQKIDAPSGTALAIADAISDVLSSRPAYVYDRHSKRKRRSKNEIGLHAVRGGTIVGEHEVIFAGTDEVIEIKHHAASKEVFGVGAIRAAKFLVGKAAGLYNMKHLVSQM